MKRLRVDEPAVKESSGSLLSSAYPRPSATPISTISYSASSTLKVSGSSGEGMQSGLYPPAPPVSYGTMPSATTPHLVSKPQPMQPLTVVGSGHSQMRTKGASPPNAPPPPSTQQSPGGGSSFQRLKVEDALTYLDLVKFKFGTQPQVQYRHL